MLDVKMIATTAVRPEAIEVLDWSDPITDSDAEYLAEFAGRACYQSWDRPNPRTATAPNYIRRNILAKGHESVLEHASASFYVTGVSRSLSHELIRHRHLSFSELSQRYVEMDGADFILPPALRDAARPARVNSGVLDDKGEEEFFQDSGYFEEVRAAYNETLDLFSVAEEDYGFSDIGRKRKREAARSVMPNCTETRFVVTGNMRSWRQVIRLRGSLAADAEIREFAIEVFRQLRYVSPSIFYDMEISTSDDGREFIR